MLLCNAKKHGRRSSATDGWVVFMSTQGERRRSLQLRLGTDWWAMRADGSGLKRLTTMNLGRAGNPEDFGRTLVAGKVTPSPAGTFCWAMSRTASYVRQASWNASNSRVRHYLADDPTRVAGGKGARGNGSRCRASRPDHGSRARARAVSSGSVGSPAGKPHAPAVFARSFCTTASAFATCWSGETLLMTLTILPSRAMTKVVRSANP